MHIEVESFTDHAGVPRPRRLHLRGQAVDVVDILDQWPGADHRYVKLTGSDGGLYILRFEPLRDAWQLTLFASERAQALSADSHDRWQGVRTASGRRA